MIRFGKKTYLSDIPISIPRLSYYLGNDAQYMVDVDSTNYSYDNLGNIFYYGTLPKQGIKSSGIFIRLITRIPAAVMASYFISLIEIRWSIF